MYENMSEERASTDDIPEHPITPSVNWLYMRYILCKLISIVIHPSGTCAQLHIIENLNYSNLSHS